MSHSGCLVCGHLRLRQEMRNLSNCGSATTYGKRVNGAAPFGPEVVIATRNPIALPHICFVGFDDASVDIFVLAMFALCRIAC